MKTIHVSGVIGVELFQRALEPQRSQNSWSAVSRSNDIQHVQVMLSDDIVQMGVYEDQPGTCSPVAYRSVSRACRGQHREIEDTNQEALA